VITFYCSLSAFHFSLLTALRSYLTSQRDEARGRWNEGNLAEAFRKRKYPKSFISKLTDSEGEAAETQVWLDYALECGYIDIQKHSELFDKYDHIISMLVNMSIKPENWTF